ncbi:MFS transporter, partial [Candidatus Aerophobetes bacterium]|nr:MFS transporter [Candidatus Aerophobetes bacterium]
MIMPILPMLITTLGGGGVVVGLTGGLRDSISSILKIFAGYLSDKTGRRKIFVSSGYLSSSLFKLLLAFSKTWEHILIFASLERVGKGIRTAPRDAIIADSAQEKRGKGFGIHRTLDTSGAILGSFSVFLLVWSLNFNLNTIILIAAIVAFISLIPLYFVKEIRREPQDITLKIGLKNLPPSLKLFILVCGIFSLANFSYMFFILKVREFFTGRLAFGMPILFYVLFNLFYAIFAIPFGSLSDKIGKKKVIICGYLLFSGVCVGFSFLFSITAFLILFALYGITYAMIDGNQRALVADLASEKLRATALGTFHTLTGLLALPSSLIAGALWQINPSATFIYGAVVGSASAI